MRTLARLLHARFEAGVASAASPEAVTNAAVLLWRDISSVLAPIIGRLGMSALFRRALSISLSEVPRFAVALADEPQGDEFAGLRKSLSSLSGPDVVKATEVLLRNFCELLASLIGDALSERLLNHVSDVASSGGPPQEISK